MNCTGCLKDIPDDQPYFKGSYCLLRNTEKFGCAPYTTLCRQCSEKIPHWSYQPERSKREDLLCPSCHSHRIEHVIRAGNFPVVYCHDCKDEVMEEDLIRCGALNSMET